MQNIVGNSLHSNKYSGTKSNKKSSGFKEELNSASRNTKKTTPKRKLKKYESALTRRALRVKPEKNQIPKKNKELEEPVVVGGQENQVLKQAAQLPNFLDNENSVDLETELSVNLSEPTLESLVQKLNNEKINLETVKTDEDGTIDVSPLDNLLEMNDKLVELEDSAKKLLNKQLHIKNKILQNNQTTEGQGKAANIVSKLQQKQNLGKLAYSMSNMAPKIEAAPTAVINQNIIDTNGSLSAPQIVMGAPEVQANLAKFSQFSGGDSGQQNLTDQNVSSFNMNPGATVESGENGFQTTFNQINEEFSGLVTESKTDRSENIQNIIQNARVRLKDGGGEVQIVLKPDGLGKVNLKVASHEGKIAVEMTSDSVQGRKILEESAKDIKVALEAINLNVDEIKVELADDYEKDFSNQRNEFEQEQNREFARNFMQKFRDERGEFRQGLGFSSPRRGQDEVDTILDSNSARSTKRTERNFHLIA